MEKLPTVFLLTVTIKNIGSIPLDLFSKNSRSINLNGLMLFSYSSYGTIGAAFL